MSAPPIRGAYSLVDHHGRPVTEQTYRGTWQLVQFGFTSCQVVCPRALSKLSAALEQIEETGPAPITPLYITVDPDRDSPAVMKAFLEASYPRFTGLTGTAAQLAEAARAFKVFTRRRADDTLAHTAITYLLDPQIRLALHWGDTRDAPAIADDLARLLGPDRTLDPQDVGRRVPARQTAPGSRHGAPEVELNYLSKPLTTSRET